MSGGKAQNIGNDDDVCDDDDKQSTYIYFQYATLVTFPTGKLLFPLKTQEFLV